MAKRKNLVTGAIAGVPSRPAKAGDTITLYGVGFGSALAIELVKIFLAARFSGADRHRRRIGKVLALERVVPKQIV